MVAFQNALRAGPFTQSLAKRPPQTFTEILSRATKYINTEKEKQAKRGQTTPEEADLRDLRRNLRALTAVSRTYVI